MPGFTDVQEQAILNLFLRADAWTLAGLHVGLSTTTPTEAAGNFTEPSGNGYARVSKPRAATDWAAASGTAPAVADNATAITFPTASGGSWGSVTYFGLFSAATAGTLYFWGALTTAKTVNDGDTASFAVGALDAKLGDPADTY